ncbi:hypothetical protein, partial [Deinococcus pimensis]|uniref:hypothetical protein n=1 Tax=Deinococcus pimensis TaxID=309888 RepID=UPI0005EB41FE
GGVAPTDTIVGLARAGAGGQVAVAFTDRIELRNADGVVQTTIRPPASGQTGTFNPCFVKFTANATGSRFTVLNACPNEPLRVAQFESTGTLRWTRELNALPLRDTERQVILNSSQSGFSPSPILLASGGTDDDTVILTRRLNEFTVGSLSSLFRVSRTDTVTGSADQIANLTLNDLASLNGSFYVGTNTGTYLLNPQTGQPGTTALVTDRATRLFAVKAGSADLLVSWDGTAAARAFLPGTPATSVALSSLFVLRDVTVSSDNYLYALTSGDVIRFDLSVLGTTRTPERTTLLGVGNLVDDGRFIATVTP